MDADVDTLVQMLGGTKTGSGDNAVWNAPKNISDIEKSCEIVPEQGLKLSIPRLRMSCKLNWDAVRTNVLGIVVTGVVLNPEKDGVSKISAVEVNATPVA